MDGRGMNSDPMTWPTGTRCVYRRTDPVVRDYIARVITHSPKRVRIEYHKNRTYYQATVQPESLKLVRAE